MPNRHPKQGLKNIFSSSSHEKKHDQVREELRQNCKKRIREQREILIEELRFGTVTDADASKKLEKIIPEIIHKELNSLASSDEGCNVPTSPEFVEKVLNDAKTEFSSEQEKQLAEDIKSIAEMMKEEKSVSLA